MEEAKQYLLIGDDDKQEEFKKVVDERIKFLQENTNPNLLVDWNKIAHQIRVDTAAKLGLILRW